MAKWLLKTEPSVYSYSDLQRDKKTVWDGVTSPWAMPYIRRVKPGDLAFIYHTGEEKQVMGIAEITSESYPDPKKGDDEYLQVFDIRAVRKLKNPVTLAQVKADKRFADSKLVRNPRLSVQPVTDAMWNGILQMSGMEAITGFSKNGKKKK
ncbi:MAG: EVE domain-containing protein [Chlorobi bacterium]|nr:EVE domain-containing protein [Chlorobiota bacterium]MCI0716703.1 EVE domain-containing protein [Chlorobiota bacterium]